MTELPNGPTLCGLVDDLGRALLEVDAHAPVGSSRTRVYRPGIGPLTEDRAIELALAELRVQMPEVYGDASKRAYPGSQQSCDVVIPGRWAIEVKLIRPFGDNGVEAEHWSENILHPYPGNTSAIGDCLKLLASGFRERKAVIVLGYEHTPPRLNLETVVRAFEAVTEQVLEIQLSDRCQFEAVGLIHPVHQQLKVFGWEVLGKPSA